MSWSVFCCYNKKPHTGLFIIKRSLLSGSFQRQRRQKAWYCCVARPSCWVIMWWKRRGHNTCESRCGGSGSPCSRSLSWQWYQSIPSGLPSWPSHHSLRIRLSTQEFGGHLQTIALATDQGQEAACERRKLPTKESTALPWASKHWHWSALNGDTESPQVSYFKSDTSRDIGSNHMWKRIGRECSGHSPALGLSEHKKFYAFCSKRVVEVPMTVCVVSRYASCWPHSPPLSGLIFKVFKIEKHVSFSL